MAKHWDLWLRVKATSAASVCAILAASCGYRPARFTERPPVTDARDRAPSPVPDFRWVAESVYLSEAYLHRPIRATLDLDPYPPAGDVNAEDEVPRSSWFEPRPFDVGSIARGPDGPGAPRPPFTVTGESPMVIASSGFSIVDARGQHYEILVDPADRPEMRTGAAAVAARLVWALGYNTPAAYVTHVTPEHFWRAEGSAPDVPAMLTHGSPASKGEFRVTALALPPGLVLGYAPVAGVRGDDPNDVIPHENRRTLRALKVFASWLSLAGIGASKTVDRYRGAPGEGYVVHYLAGLDDALGASDVVRVTDLPPGEGGGSPLLRLVTLGLAPNPAPRPTQIEVPAVGRLDEHVAPAAFGPSVPYEPIDRLTFADAYWAAKRIAALTPSHIALAIEAGKFTDNRAKKMLQTALEARRLDVVRYWFDRVSPVELTRVDGAKLAFVDMSLLYGVSGAESTDYQVDFLTSDGKSIGHPMLVRAVGDRFEVNVPEEPLGAARDYLVVRVLVRRDLRRASRAFAVHVKLVGSTLNVLGLRH